MCFIVLVEYLVERASLRFVNLIAQQKLRGNDRVAVLQAGGAALVAKRLTRKKQSHYVTSVTRIAVTLQNAIASIEVSLQKSFPDR
jgi:hypothetical protein